MADSDGRKYDVFLSFRGEDTRKNFICHLYRALEQKLIGTFIDSENLEKGNKISELLNAIEDSRLSIVVLSENYASSSWCLKELVKILECMDTNHQIVLPIFYQVDPSDIRNLNGKFGEAFANKFGGAENQELESWRSALARVAGLSGWDSTNYPDDIKLIEEIVEHTLKKWIHVARPSNPVNDLVGMDAHIKEMTLRLRRGVNDVGVVGIWGMGGIGKTTIAKVVYDKIGDQFEHKCFLHDVKEGFAKKGEAQMRGEFLSEILKDKMQTVGILKEGYNMIMERLGKKKVLVVLDDVETVAHIRDLVGNPHSFGVGSRIIITTRNKQSLSGVNEFFEPKALSGDEADELFMKHAFNTKKLTGDYNHLSRRAIKYAQGLPLALKVLGASLRDRTVHEWEEVLEKLKTIPNGEILNVLETSYNRLDISQKGIFLDIACFFRKLQKYRVIELLHSFNFFPYSGLSTLRERALLTTSSHNYGDDTIEMHDLLQEMGKAIVCRDSLDEPGRRSRLWRYEDVQVLTKKTATKAIEGISLDLSNSKFDLCIDTGAFVRMTKLRVLMIYYSFFSIYRDYENLGYEDICPSDGCKQHWKGDFEFLSHELRFLVWHGSPLKSLPSNFHPKNLLRLDMRGSHIEQLWEGIKQLNTLKVILLSNCRYLVKTPDLTEVTNLERLVLDGCSSLIEVHSSISALQKLEILTLKGCKELRIFPRSIYMKSLGILDLSGCSNLDKFPEISEVMKDLINLFLDETAIKELPTSINNLTSLSRLHLRCCTELNSLASSGMKSLFIIDVSGCSNLEEFPEISEEMENLMELHLGRTAIKELPSSINNLAKLVTLNLKGCRELKILPSCIHMKSVKTLDLSGCQKLEKFPEISGIMMELTELRLDETGIKELPSSIEHLQGLKSVSMKYCRRLTSLPDSICNLAHLTFLDLSGCSKLSSLPENVGSLESLSELEVQGSGIKQLPLSISRLRELKISLSCNGLNAMKTPFSAWSSSIARPPFQHGHQHTDHQRHLELSDSNLLELSESIAHLSSLDSLKLCRNNFESLPVPEPQSERKEEKELMVVSAMEEESTVGRGSLGPLCRCFYWLGALWR